MTFHKDAPRAQEPNGQTPFHVWTGPDGSEWTHFYRSGDRYLVRFPELADFEVSSDGNTVRCWPVPGVSDPAVEQLYLNQVLPLALSRQGCLVFHASAIAAMSGALVFMGLSGRGKSTLAASFASTGLGFLTDDGLLLSDREGGYVVEPSHPSLRLWEDSHEALFSAETPTAPAVEYTSKARYLASAGLVHCETARPLRRIYFLGEGTAADVEFTAVSPSEALMELVHHSFLLETQQHGSLAWHFDRMAELAERPLFCRLDYPRSYDGLARVRAAVLEHAAKEIKGS